VQKFVKKSKYFHSYQYIFSLLSFVITNMEQYITNSDIHGINTRYGSNMHQTISNLLYIKEVLIVWDSKGF